MRLPVSSSVLRTVWCASLVCALAFSGHMASRPCAAPPAEPVALPAALPELQRRFASDVQPLVTAHCLGCHGPTKQESKLDLSQFASAADVAGGFATWELVAERLVQGDMPPADAATQPTEAQRAAAIRWIRELGDLEAARNAGDPGPVLARRLSNSEYNRSIRDLTGVDLQPAREFPVDPANEAGFDNTGESLAMSPALLQKYLEAARKVAEHLVLKPSGFTFAPYPVVAETDRDHYCVHRIVDFYKRHQVDLADYLYAAWRYRQRAGLGEPEATLPQVAQDLTLSPRYLELLWKVVSDPAPGTGPLAQVRAAWQALPGEAGQAQEVRAACVTLRDETLKLRQRLVPKAPRIHVQGISDGSQPFVLWANRQLAESRMKSPQPEQDDADTQLFCRVFPHAFVVYDRAPYFDPKAAGQGRLLTAGFHLMQGYFRDDTPLYELVLDDAARQEINELWRELDFITLAPLRQYKDFIFFERAEPPRYMVEARFDFARAEDKDAISPAKLSRLHDEYRDKAQSIGANEQALAAIDEYFTDIERAIRRVEEGRAQAEASHLEALVDFANRACRRPLSATERSELLAFYQELRAADGLTHEEAVRDALASILLSPYFSYRFDLAPRSAQREPLDPYELASRLSYFLWSSLPDNELLSHAAAGDLTRPDVLVAQTRRMLRDPRIRGLAEEFAANWFDIRRFEEHNAVDRDRFPAFTNELRDAMYEEPIRFMVDLFRENRPITDVLYARHTFVNPLLAQHYGMPAPDGTGGEWVRIDDARPWGRGGLLTMAAFLTRNAPGQRTSPVKRGYWVVRRLLGEHIPAPPPEVPELPKDEAATGELTLPQLLARHRDHKACAGCHHRFDAVGLVFEGFGPIGERRERDLGGRPVDDAAVFPDGSTGRGPDGLRQYLHERREPEFVDNFCRKLLGYALGRSLLPSDRSLLQTMKERLASTDQRCGGLVEAIVTSPQFVNKRGLPASPQGETGP